MLTLDAKNTETTNTAEDAHRAASAKLVEWEKSTADLKALEASHESFITNFRRTNSAFDSTIKGIEDLQAKSDALKADVTKAARTLKISIHGNGSVAMFSDPKRAVVDGHKLFAAVPALAGDVHLVTGFKVDMEVFKSYVVLGKIPAEVAEAVVSEEHVNKAGRVQVKVLK